MIKKRILIAAILAGVSSVPALAADAAEPAVQTYENTRYLTGGIGQDEAQAMRQAASRYPLAMTFVAKTGQYVSDVKVTIKKQKGGDTVLSAVSGGPMMLVDLPPGQYNLEATVEDKTLTRKVSIVKGKHQRLMLRWDKVGGA